MTSELAGREIDFDDGEAYERFMGRWSRAAGFLFLDWLAPPAEMHWLEVGCGTGALTRLVTEYCRPVSIVAVDPAAAQIAYARRSLDGHSVVFKVAAAEALPCQNDSYDVVVSALAINFMRDRRAAAREMRRVTRAGGTMAGYVWDFPGQRTPHAPLVRAFHRLGIDTPKPPGGEECSITFLHALFADAGLLGIETTVLDIEVRFPNFAAFWAAQTPSFSPTTRLIASLEEPTRDRLKTAIRTELADCADGEIAYAARAHAVRGLVPSRG